MIDDTDKFFIMTALKVSEVIGFLLTHLGGVVFSKTHEMCNSVYLQ